MSRNMHRYMELYDMSMELKPANQHSLLWGGQTCLFSLSKSYILAHYYPFFSFNTYIDSTIYTKQLKKENCT